MSDYVDTVDIEGTQYDIQDTATKQTAEQNTQDIQGLAPVDTIQNGNMKAVTSNAVFQALQNVGSNVTFRIRIVRQAITPVSLQPNQFGTFSAVTPSPASGWKLAYVMPSTLLDNQNPIFAIPLPATVAGGISQVFIFASFAYAVTVNQVDFFVLEYQ